VRALKQFLVFECGIRLDPLSAICAACHLNIDSVFIRFSLSFPASWIFCVLSSECEAGAFYRLESLAAVRFYFFCD